MFQTEINHFLQSFEHPFLTAFFQFITALGYMEFFIIFLVLLLFAVDFKKGFLLFQVLMWTAAITFLAKNAFALPRPIHVDNTVKFLDHKLPGSHDFDFEKRGAKGFFSTLPADVIEYTRKSPDLEYGFPSGHSSIAIAFWGTLFLLFKQRWFQFICCALMFLIPFSRLYLGVHFLADVLGGITLGAMVLLMVYRVFLKHDQWQNYLQSDRPKIGVNQFTILLILPGILLLLILPVKLYILPAFMLGVGIGFLLLTKTAVPTNQGDLIQRVLRTILAFCLLAFVGLAFSQILKMIGLNNPDIVKAIIAFFAALVLSWIAPLIAIRLKWFNT